MYVFTVQTFVKVHVGATFLHDKQRFEKIGTTTAQAEKSGLIQTFLNETEVWVYHSTERIEAPSSTEVKNDGN